MRRRRRCCACRTRSRRCPTGKTGCAIAAVTDPGLAKAFVSALAQADPEQYSNTAAELAAQTRTDTGTAPTGGGRNGKRRKRV